MSDSLNNTTLSTLSLVYVFNITNTEFLVSINSSATLDINAFFTSNSNQSSIPGNNGSSSDGSNDPQSKPLIPNVPLYTPNSKFVEHVTNDPIQGFTDKNNNVSIQDASNNTITFKTFDLPTPATADNVLFMYIFLSHLLIINTEGIVLMKVDVQTGGM